MLHVYQGNLITQRRERMPNARQTPEGAQIPVERVQLGARMEKRMVKVLKALAEYHDVSLGQLLEDIVLHSFAGEGACAFGPDSLKRIADLKRVYGMDYDVHASYRFIDRQQAEEATLPAEGR
jgi:hypothetical protein